MIKNDVGMNAGKVYRLLCKKGKLSLREIGESTHSSELTIYLAIGWLLRENKINITEQNEKLFFELNDSLSEMYY